MLCLQEWHVNEVYLKTPQAENITIMIELRRGSLFYFLNLIFPCLLILIIYSFNLISLVGHLPDLHPQPHIPLSPHLPHLFP